MRVDIRDAATVSTLRPLDVVSYFRAERWKPAETVEGEYAVWLLNDDVEAFLPLRTDTPDYALRMGDLLRVLSVVEDRSQTSILSDLLTTSSDVVRLRLIDEELADGSMAIDEYTRTSQKARELMLAAACSATSNRAVWPNRKPDKAINFLRNVRVGQSERGSYVLKILSPVPPRLAASENGHLFDDPSPPFERKVTTALAAALQGASSAAESAATRGDASSFEKAVAAGASANFCEALAGLSIDEDRDRAIEVSFTWSKTRPASKEAMRRIRIGADRIPYLLAGAQMLRERSPVEGFELTGAVIKLERAATDGPGSVTVHAPVDDKMKRIKLALQEADYATACAAHGDGLDVSCVGRLVREGRSFELRNPTNLFINRED